MNNKQTAFIVFSLLLSLLAPSFSVGLIFLSMAIGAYLSIVLR